MMSTGEPYTRHKVFPPQRMHTRSRSNVNRETITETVRSGASISQQPTQQKKTNSTKSKMFTCDQCGNPFKTLGGLKRHQVTHIKKKSYRSGKCQQIFTLKDELARHVHMHHNPSESNDVSVQNTEAIPVYLIECPKQEDKSEDFQDDLDVSIKKHGNKNSIPEVKLEQTSKENYSLVNNLSQGKEETEVVYDVQQESSIVTEMKSDTLLEQVLEHITNAEGQVSEEVIGNEMETHQSKQSFGKSQEFAGSGTTENETFIVVEHGNDITDLLLQDDCFKLSSQSRSSGSQTAHEKTTYMDIKPGMSLLPTNQQDSVQISSIDQSVNNSKEMLTSGQMVSTPIHSNVTSGITTIGHIKPASGPNHVLGGNTKLAQLSDKHVSIKSHFSKEDIDMEVSDDHVFGLVSGLVKFCPDLSETDYTEVAKVTGVTVIMLDKQKIVVHGSWKALNRAYAMIENLQVEAKKERSLLALQEDCVGVSSPVECVANSTPVECNNEDQLEQNGVETNAMVTNDSDNEVTIETSHSVDLDNLDPSSIMEPDTFLCDKCSKLFWSRRSLQEHIALRHSEHKCKVCSKVFSERRYLQTHLKRHANVRNYTCPICGWKFMERFKMKLHMESHKERKDRCLPYKCAICGNQFYNRASWSDHLNTHTGNRPYSCMLCSNTFAHRIGLKRHMMTHLKEKPYKCGQCDRSFSFRSKLTDHMTMHTGISKHKCSHCDRIFTASSSLRRHMEQCPCKPPGPEIIEPITMAMAVEGLQATDSDTIYMCGICGETFDSLLKAEKHTIDHEQSVTTTETDKTIVIQEDKEFALAHDVAVISEPAVTVAGDGAPVAATQMSVNHTPSITKVDEPLPK
ncbi:uncharacterized protein LOC117345307 [Pecten maximus]|uniref:uncharacterized protein LOC117345307 n=1 Tax=Pecten maximus TaxID=6579 RepID=UPI001457F124|nr:uncharacterized protein LOC117345307 [Pecten maximus]